MKIHWDTYLKDSYKQYLIIIIIIAAGCLFLSIGSSLAWLFGNASFYLNLCLKYEYFDYILTMKSFSKGIYVIYFLISLILLMLPSILFFFLFGVKEMMAAFLGVLGFRLFWFLSNLFMKGGKDNSFTS